jgi:LysM domain-containing protein
MSFWKDIAEWVEHIFFPAHDDPDPDPVCEIKVRKGDSLWKLTDAFTGDGARWPELAAANPDKKFDQDYTIYPGEVLKVPCAWIDELAGGG